MTNNTGKIDNYSKILSSVKFSLEKDLSDITVENYKEKLKKLGYKYHSVASINHKTDYNQILKNIPEKATGVYVFKELSNIHLNKDNWSYHKKNNVEKKAPSWKQNNLSYNSIFYVGSSEILKKRMREHIYGLSLKGTLYNTYSLKLKLFLERNTPFEYQVDIFYTNKTVEYKAVNILVEAILHSVLSPSIATARQS